MQRCFQFNNYIAQNVKKDDEIQIIEYSNKYYILHGTQYIGRLSNNSDIVKNAKQNNIHRLRGYHVSDVCVWTYEETERADKDNNTTFSELWCMEAKAQGYIYIIQIAGFGMPF